jgi:hypothetical protein
MQDEFDLPAEGITEPVQLVSSTQWPSFKHLSLTSLSGTISPGINFKRDDSSSTEDSHSECEGSAIIPILGSLSGDGLPGFQAALVAKLGEGWLNTTVPENYTIVGWNSTTS